MIDVALAPIDKTARLVISKGEHFDLPLKKGMWTQLPAWAAPPYDIKNLIGQTNGRMTIIAYKCYAKIKGGRGKKHRWYARCSCGNVEVRNHRTWVNNFNKGREDYGCAICRQTKNICEGK